MREILFRGKSLKDGKWVCGDLLQFQSYDVIHQRENGCRVAFDIDYSTIGQYTGLKDRNGQRIFENDIVEFCCCTQGARYLIWWNREMSMMTAIPIDGISFNGADYWNGNYPKFDYGTFCLMMQDPWGDFGDIKVIGNIHDNPELMEVNHETD